MLRFTKGQTATIICTLTEKQTIVDANYLFVFTSRASNQVVSFVIVNSSDLSSNKERWNEFSFSTNTHFQNYPEGWWDYEVYEQVSTTNTTISLSGGLLEKGLMWLDDNTQPTVSTYSQDINFTFYNGS